MPKRFDQARPFATLAIVALVWLALSLTVKAFLRASFFEMTAPIMTTASHVRDLREFWSQQLHTKNELIEAGHDLARVNASYALAVQQNTELEAEVGRLEGLLNVPPTPGYRYETARVVQRDFSSWWQRLVIRKGRDAGIIVGSPVVYTDGVVGRVSEVHAYTSVVEMISSPDVRLAAMIEGETQPISYQGGINPTFGPAKGTIEFVPLEVFASADQPKRLVTSGLGGEFPPGLTVGRVVKVAPSTDGLFKTGEVELDTRLSELTEVTVLVPVSSH